VIAVLFAIQGDFPARCDAIGLNISSNKDEGGEPFPKLSAKILKIL
jgi:hypothetical protein